MSKVLDHHELISAIERDLGFLAACGDEARRWLAELRKDETVEIRVRLAAALDRLKKYDLKAGADDLAAIDRDIQTRDTEYPSINHLLHRYRLTALAYFHYLNGEIERAKADLLSAHEEIRALLSRHEFLTPLAIHCTDFIVQRARIARRENQWKEAERFIWTLRDLYAGVRPFLVLESGRPVGLVDIRSFYASLPLDEEQREQAHKFIGDNVPLAERVTYLEEMIFALPDVVIPYP